MYVFHSAQKRPLTRRAGLGERQQLKMAKGKELAVTPKNENEVAQFIQQAIAQNLPIETMEKLFALHREVKADAAKEAYVSALSKFQQQVPVITKTKKVKNKDGTLRYQYAPLDTIIEQIKTPLADNGLSFSWTVENTDKFIKATAKVTHLFGHSEISSFEIPLVMSEYMTNPQSYASALTFAKRYALCNALGISTAEEDTDATDVNKTKSAKSPKARMVFLLRSLGHKTDTPDQIKEAVGKYTDLKFIEKNLALIVNRLEEVVKEREGDNESPKVQ